MLILFDMFCSICLDIISNSPQKQMLIYVASYDVMFSF